MFGRTAEVAGEYLSKGSNILVEGRLKQETWEKDGQKRSKVKIICDRLVMLGSKQDGGGSSGSSSKSSGSRQKYEGYASSNADGIAEDGDIPF